jgi:hypothetical protein
VAAVLELDGRERRRESPWRWFLKQNAPPRRNPSAAVAKSRVFGREVPLLESSFGRRWMQALNVWNLDKGWFRSHVAIRQGPGRSDPLGGDKGYADQRYDGTELQRAFSIWLADY